MVTIQGGRAQNDPRDGMAVIMLIEGIVVRLWLQSSDASAYGIDFSIDNNPTLGLALRGRLLADDRRLEVDTLSSSLQLGPEQDHYLTPPMQKLLTELDINGPASRSCDILPGGE